MLAFTIPVSVSAGLSPRKKAFVQLFFVGFCLRDEVYYFSEEYTPECMHKRNRFMVDNSTHCIFYMTHMRGGTAYTVRYALESELNMHNIMI
ncbi:MAG: hypothetical protein U0M60_09120 [Clostridia bacterium]|nr:hypothetical protein [Clostridia bacterium]